jgi:hypothetical protein
MTNFWVILIAAIISMASGAIWYSPAAFGNLWVKLSGFKKEDIEKSRKKGMKKTYALNFVFEIVTAYTLAYFLFITNTEAVSQMLSVVFFVWIGFVIPIFISQMIWENKPFQLFLINSLQRLIALAIAGIILTLLG